jgi:hypothetical protein
MKTGQQILQTLSNRQGSGQISLLAQASLYHGYLPHFSYLTARTHLQ